MKRSEIPFDDFHRANVEIPEWGGSVYVQSLTVAQRDDFKRRANAAIADAATTGDASAADAVMHEFVSVVAVDDDGARLFPGGADEVAQCKYAMVVERLAEAALRLNGMSDEDVEEQVGKSEPTPKGDSS